MSDEAPPQPEKGKISKQKAYTRFVLDPFQIFCLVNRSTLIEKNPGKKNSEITSMLATIWRALPDTQKQKYQYYASKLQHNKCKVERKPKGPPKKLVKDSTPVEVQTKPVAYDFSFPDDLPLPVESEENLMAFLDHNAVSVGVDE